MSDAVLLGAIGSMQAVAVALIYVMGRRQARSTDAIRYEVTNDHDQPLRDDMDEKHGAVIRGINTVAATVRTIMRDIGGIRHDIRQLRSDLSHTDQRIDNLEHPRPHLPEGET